MQCTRTRNTHNCIHINHISDNSLPTQIHKAWLVLPRLPTLLNAMSTQAIDMAPCCLASHPFSTAMPTEAMLCQAPSSTFNCPASPVALAKKRLSTATLAINLVLSSACENLRHLNSTSTDTERREPLVCCRPTNHLMISSDQVSVDLQARLAAKKKSVPIWGASSLHTFLNVFPQLDVRAGIKHLLLWCDAPPSPLT